MNEEKVKALQTVLNGSFCFVLNMNDTFGFACAESEEMGVDDFELMVPIIAKYGHHALIAYAAVKKKVEPIHCKCGHDAEPYRQARVEVEELKAKNDYFMMAD